MLQLVLICLLTYLHLFRTHPRSRRGMFSLYKANGGRRGHDPRSFVKIGRKL